MEYHTWRNEEPDMEDTPMGGTDRMICGACEKIRSLRKAENNKRTIKSVSVAKFALFNPKMQSLISQKNEKMIESVIL